MSWVLVGLVCWLCWFVSGLLLVIYAIRQYEDINLGTLLKLAGVTSIFGPIIFICICIEDLQQAGVFNRIVIKRCKYKKAFDIIKKDEN